MMTETRSENGHEIWRNILSMHWRMLVLVVIAVILLLSDAILVFVWVVGNALSANPVLRTLGQWTMGNLVAFLVQLILWEALLVGIPIIIAAVAGWQWWKRLPSEEKRMYRFFGKRSRATGGGGSLSFFVFIAFCIKVYADGNWNVAIATWTFNYLVYSWLTALLWILIIIGIPASLALIWWLNHKMKRKP